MVGVCHLPPKRSQINRKSQRCDTENYDSLEMTTRLICAAGLTHFVGISETNTSSVISDNKEYP